VDLNIREMRMKRDAWKSIPVEIRGTCGCVRCNEEKEGVKMELFVFP
jgi:hypothetical protein